MKSIIKKYLLVFASLATTPFLIPLAIADDDNTVVPFSMKTLILYQSDEILKERLATGADMLAKYAMRIEAEANKIFLSTNPSQRYSGAVVITVKPGGQSRVWLALGDNDLPDTLKNTLLEKLTAIKSIPVKKGPIAFALKFDAWGGGKPLEETFPIPDEWRKVMKNQADSIIPDAPLAILWPDKAVVPTNFLGVWEGELDIIHAPDHKEFTKSIKYRFEFTETSVLISQKHGKDWLYNKSPPEIAYKTNNHVFMHTIYDSGQYIEMYSINLVYLDNKNLYAYVSRVVENYTIENKKKFRHFPVFAKGKLHLANRSK